MTSIGPEDDQLHPSTFAVKRWLRMAVDRLSLYPKAIYMPLGIDAGTWSRWTSYEHDQTVPTGYLPAILALLDEQARLDLVDLLTPRRGSADKQKAEQRRSAF